MAAVQRVIRADTRNAVRKKCMNITEQDLIEPLDDILAGLELLQTRLKLLMFNEQASSEHIQLYATYTSHTATLQASFLIIKRAVEKVRSK